MIFDFIDGAAGDETLSIWNQTTLQAIRLMPRVLQNVDKRNMSSNILGISTGLPFGIAPMGMCNLAWPGADLMLAREAKQRDIPIAVSTASSTSLEKIQECADGKAWFQLYAAHSKEFVDELIKRAEVANYKVLILTVDVPILSIRTKDLKSGFVMPFVFGPKQIFDLALHPRWSLSTLMRPSPKPMNFETSDLGINFERGANRGLADWDFLIQLRDRWRGKLIVKGVLCPEDALRIKKIGIDGIYVSNHGGRQMNGAPVASSVLPVIRKAVGPEMPLIFDSGIRNGEDIIKALALGASFVMVGRPIMYGLGAGAADGLARTLDILTNEASVALGLSGLTKVGDISKNILADNHLLR